jgi:hypothetical protein
VIRYSSFDMIYFLSSCVSLNFFKFALAKYTTLFPY